MQPVLTRTTGDVLASTGIVNAEVRYQLNVQDEETITNVLSQMRAELRYPKLGLVSYATILGEIDVCENLSLGHGIVECGTVRSVQRAY